MNELGTGEETRRAEMLKIPTQTEREEEERERERRGYNWYKYIHPNRNC